MIAKKREKTTKQKFSWQLVYKQRYLLLMSVPFVVWLIVFKYVPLWGWTMAFQDVRPKTFALSVWEVCRPWQFYKGFYGQTVQADDAQHDWNQYARDTAWNRDGNCLCTHAERNPVCEVQEGNADDFLSAPFCVVGSYRQYCEDGAQ